MYLNDTHLLPRPFEFMQKNFKSSTMGHEATSHLLTIHMEIYLAQRIGRGTWPPVGSPIGELSVPRSSMFIVFLHTVT